LGWDENCEYRIRANEDNVDGEPGVWYDTIDVETRVLSANDDVLNMGKVIQFPRWRKDAPGFAKLNYTLDPQKDTADQIANFLKEDGAVVAQETKKERYVLVNGKYKRV
jgi:hypothetical protein